MRPVRVAWTFLRLGAINELQYRLNFFVAAFQSLLAVAVALVVLRLVYSHTTELNGWSEPELMCVLGIQILLGGVIRAAIQPNMERIVDEVRDGKLDHALTKPEDSQLLVSVREFRIWRTVDVISGGAVLGVGLARLEASVGAGEALSFAGLLLVGGVLIYCFWLVLATGAFWIVHMWFLAELFEGVYATGRWPIGIYPGWLRYSLTWLIPIGFAITVPAEAVTSRLEWTTPLLALAFAAALFLVTRWFWRFGLRRYSGASA
ncbi:MAG: ABC-2 family transporter protein [Thermoleophilia bacterium]|nr:ABC-2 family transporter protein [Thermoleophilia bacterium]